MLVLGKKPYAEYSIISIKYINGSINTTSNHNLCFDFSFIETGESAQSGGSTTT